jgi:hypothetical protein
MHIACGGVDILSTCPPYSGPILGIPKENTKQDHQRQPFCFAATNDVEELVCGIGVQARKHLL